jgi:Protein of unknown function (DUF4238)
VAVEAGFYTTEELDGSKSVIVEEGLANIDGEAHAVIETVLSDGVLPGSGTSQRETLAYYLAIQKSRTPESRGFASFPTDVLAYTGGRTVDSELIADYLEHVHLEAYAKASLKKYRPIAVRNDDKKVFSGLL